MTFLRIQFYPDGGDGPVRAFMDQLARERPRTYLRLALDLEVLGAEGARSSRVKA